MKAVPPFFFQMQQKAHQAYEADQALLTRPSHNGWEQLSKKGNVIIYKRPKVIACACACAC